MLSILPNCLLSCAELPDCLAKGHSPEMANSEFYLNIQIREEVCDYTMSQNRPAASTLWSYNGFIFKGRVPLTGFGELGRQMGAFHQTLTRGSLCGHPALVSWGQNQT